MPNKSASQKPQPDKVVNNTKTQGQTGNTYQNLTHQGHQQDR